MYGVSVTGAADSARSYGRRKPGLWLKKEPPKLKKPFNGCGWDLRNISYFFQPGPSEISRRLDQEQITDCTPRFTKGCSVHGKVQDILFA